MKWLLLALMACVCGGCGGSAYEGLLKKRSDQITKASIFAVLWPGPSEISGTNLVIRLPTIFDRCYNKSSNYTSDANGVIDPERLNPPFMNPFPGLLGCYEAFVKPASGDGLPEYLYMGIKELTADGKVAFMQDLAGKLKQLDPAATWNDTEVEGPKGDMVRWKVIAASMAQVFFPQGKGRDGAKTLPGFFEVWLFEAPGGVVLLAWRAPDEAAAVNDYHALAKLTAGTMETKPEAPAQPGPEGAAAVPAEAPKP